MCDDQEILLREDIGHEIDRSPNFHLEIGSGNEAFIVRVLKFGTHEIFVREYQDGGAIKRRNR